MSIIGTLTRYSSRFSFTRPFSSFSFSFSSSNAFPNPNPSTTSISLSSPWSPSHPNAARHFSGGRSLLSHRAQIRSSATLGRCFERRFQSIATKNSFEGVLKTLEKPGGGEFGRYYSLPALNDPRIDRLPYSIRILLESAIRNCDEFQVTGKDVEKIIDWENSSPKQVEIPFKPARVLLQDFTGVPAVVDLACMRDAMIKLGGGFNKINPLPMKMVLPGVVGFKLSGNLNGVTATDLDLTVTHMLQKHSVV